MSSLMREYQLIWYFSTPQINLVQCSSGLISLMVRLIGKSEDQLPSLRHLLKDLKRSCSWIMLRSNVKDLLTSSTNSLDCLSIQLEVKKSKNL